MTLRSGAAPSFTMPQPSVTSFTMPQQMPQPSVTSFTMPQPSVTMPQQMQPSVTSFTTQPSVTSFTMPQQMQQQPSVTMPQQQQPSVTMPQQQRQGKSEWHTPLLPDISTCSQCATATVCPCMWVHLSAEKLLKENGKSGAGSSWYGGLLSGMICLPTLFCLDRTATHALNGAMDSYDEVPAHDDDEEENNLSQVSHIIWFVLVHLVRLGASDASGSSWCIRA